MKGWTQVGKRDSWSAYSPMLSLYFPVLSLVLQLYFGSTGVSPFLPWIDFNIIGKNDLIYIRKKFLIKCNFMLLKDVHTLRSKKLLKKLENFALKKKFVKKVCKL